MGGRHRVLLQKNAVTLPKFFFIIFLILFCCFLALKPGTCTASMAKLRRTRRYHLESQGGWQFEHAGAGHSIRLFNFACCPQQGVRRHNLLFTLTAWPMATWTPINLGLGKPTVSGLGKPTVFRWCPYKTLPSKPTRCGDRTHQRSPATHGWFCGWPPVGAVSSSCRVPCVAYTQVRRLAGV